MNVLGVTVYCFEARAVPPVSMYRDESEEASTYRRTIVDLGINATRQFPKSTFQCRDMNLDLPAI